MDLHRCLCDENNISAQKMVNLIESKSKFNNRVNFEFIYSNHVSHIVLYLYFQAEFSSENLYYSFESTYI